MEQLVSYKNAFFLRTDIVLIGSSLQNYAQLWDCRVVVLIKNMELNSVSFDVLIFLNL